MGYTPFRSTVLASSLAADENPLAGQSAVHTLDFTTNTTEVLGRIMSQRGRWQRYVLFSLAIRLRETVHSFTALRRCPAVIHRPTNDW